MSDPGSSRTFRTAIPGRHTVSLVGVCLILVALAGYAIHEGIRFLTTPLVGGYEVLAFTVPTAAVLLFVAATMVVADRAARDAWVAVDDDGVTLHSRGVLTRNVVVPMSAITRVQSYPWQHPASQLPRDSASVTPLSMGPWLALTVTPMVLPAKRSTSLWWRLFRWSDFSHVRTPSPGRTCSTILFGTAQTVEAADAIRRRFSE